MKDNKNLGYQKKIHCVFSPYEVVLWIGIVALILFDILMIIAYV